jgi:hypothetical protein
MWACDERNIVGSALFTHGYCFVGMGAVTLGKRTCLALDPLGAGEANCH